MRFKKSLPVLRILAGALLLALAGLLLIHRDQDSGLYPPLEGDSVTVWVADNGFHSDLVLPTERLRARGGPMAEALKAMPPTPFVAIGWGDAKFFTDSSPAQGRILDGLRALFAPGNPSVVRIDPLNRPPAEAYRETVLELQLSRAGFERLVRHLDRSFTLTLEPVAPLPKAPFDSRYFRSREQFSVLHDCNDWTAQMISAAGAPTRPAVDALSAGLDWDLMTEDGAKRLR
jgi:hypothetical protein